MHSLYRNHSLPPAPVRLEDFLSPHVQVLIKKLENGQKQDLGVDIMLTTPDHVDIQDTRAPHSREPNTEQVAEAVVDPTSSLPPFTFPPQQPQADYSSVDINELSVGLGLPTLNVDAKDDASPAASNRSRNSQAHPGALYGKLIGWALNKPLTAKGLAEYLQSQDSHHPNEPPSPTSILPNMTIVHQDARPVLPKRATEPTRKTNMYDLSRAHVLGSTQAVATPKGPSALHHQHRRSSNSSTSYQHHVRNPSSRKQPRRTSRAKRMDQGPMPSAADIYPDDTDWTLPAPIYEGIDYMAYNNQPFERPEMVVDNIFDWPPPAQAYKPGPAPTKADIDAADDDVLSLVREIPEPSLATIVNLGASLHWNVSTGLGLPCETRPLTPAQVDGTRYGMRFYGLAYGDQWELSKVGDFCDSESFRVRPREHDGWGGWEWALRKGWNG